jgi:putative ABC transport system ATP-binding protein
VYHVGKTQVHALRGIDLTVPRGQMISIMGASGSGKSTLLNIIGCLDRPTRGTYELDGARVEALSRNQLADIRNAKIGFVFQSLNLLPRTNAIENVELPLLYDRSGRATDTRAAAIAALERVGLRDRLEHDPAELSGGEQQRVAIARALVTEPAIVLADEPTGNLDTRTSLGIMALLQSLNADGATIIVVTHEPDLARCAGRVVELRDGRIVRDEPIEAPASAEDALASLGEPVGAGAA